MLKKNKKNSLYMMRVIFCIIGVTLTCITASIFYLAQTGSDPYQVFVTGIHQTLGITYGQASTLLNAVIAVFFLIFQRKYIHLALFLSVFYSGPCIDVLNSLLAGIITPELPIHIKFMLTIFGCICLAFGCFLYMSSELGASPPDGLGMYISEKSKIPYNKIRIGTDTFFLIIGMVFGGTAGMSTIAAVLLTGPLIGVFKRHMPAMEPVAV